MMIFFRDYLNERLKDDAFKAEYAAIGKNDGVQIRRSTRYSHRTSTTRKKCVLLMLRRKGKLFGKINGSASVTRNRPYGTLAMSN